MNAPQHGDLCPHCEIGRIIRRRDGLGDRRYAICDMCSMTWSIPEKTAVPDPLNLILRARY